MPAPSVTDSLGAGKIGNYMAMALPVVAFDTPVSREYLGDLGVYAERGNSRSLAAKLCEVQDNPQHYREVGARLRQRCVEELSWQDAIERIEAVYGRATGARTGPPGCRRGR